MDTGFPTRVIGVKTRDGICKQKENYVYLYMVKMYVCVGIFIYGFRLVEYIFLMVCGAKAKKGTWKLNKKMLYKALTTSYNNTTWTISGCNELFVVVV